MRFESVIDGLTVGILASIAFGPFSAYWFVAIIVWSLLSSVGRAVDYGRN